MNELSRLGKEKYFANKGVKRNKTPLTNLVYKVTLTQLKKDVSQDVIDEFEKYKFKDQGYIWLTIYLESGQPKSCGNVTLDKLKEMLGEKQYSKFCGQGKREFIIQRRVNGKNL